MREKMEMGAFVKTVAFQNAIDAKIYSIHPINAKLNAILKTAENKPVVKKSEFIPTLIKILAPKPFNANSVRSVKNVAKLDILSENVMRRNTSKNN